MDQEPNYLSSSNCDYDSDVFKEQVSKDIFTQNFVSEDESALNSPEYSNKSNQPLQWKAISKPISTGAISVCRNQKIPFVESKIPNQNIRSPHTTFVPSAISKKLRSNSQDRIEFLAQQRGDSRTGLTSKENRVSPFQLSNNGKNSDKKQMQVLQEQTPNSTVSKYSIVNRMYQRASSSEKTAHSANVQNYYMSANQMQKKTAGKATEYSSLNPGSVQNNTGQLRKGRNEDLVNFKETTENDSKSAIVFKNNSSYLDPQQKAANSSSMLNLTPQKELPVPMSQEQFPHQSMGPNSRNSAQKAHIMAPSSSFTMFNVNPVTSEDNESRAFKKTATSHGSTNKLTSSTQKQAVVYNEFKYQTGNSTVKYNTTNQTGETVQVIEQKEAVSPSYITVQKRVGGNPDSSSLILQHPPSGESPSLYSNSLKGPKRKQSVGSSGKESHENSRYEKRIGELQSQISKLESQLKETRLRNSDIEAKVASRKRTPQHDPCFIGIFSSEKKSNSCLTEDSLLLSEKKKYKQQKRSIGSNDSFLKAQQLSQSTFNNPSFKSKQTAEFKADSGEKDLSEEIVFREEAGEHSKQSSIVDVKILPKSPQKDSQEQSMKIEEHGDLYQVDSFHNDSSALLRREEPRPTESEEDDCAECEKLKQLVFQAKEAIDDLKAEVEEWRGLSALRETELRQIRHFLGNELGGLELAARKVDFNEQVVKLEFDQTLPVSSEKKNFLRHNKKRLRCRSSSKKKLPAESDHKGAHFSGAKKSSLKKDMLQSLLSEEEALFFVEDRACQTEEHQDVKLKVAQKLKNSASVLHSACQADLTNVTSLKQSVATTQYSQELQAESTLDQAYPSQTTFAQKQIGDEQEKLEKENAEQEQVLRHKTQLLLENEEELRMLNLKLNSKDSELAFLKKELQRTLLATDNINSALGKAKKNIKNKQKANVDVEEPTQLSDIQSYSILEKIEQWKEEQGFSNLKRGDMPQSKIPRPVALLQESSEQASSLREEPSLEQIISAGNLSQGTIV